MLNGYFERQEREKCSCFFYFIRHLTYLPCILMRGLNEFSQTDYYRFIDEIYANFETKLADVVDRLEW